MNWHQFERLGMVRFGCNGPGIDPHFGAIGRNDAPLGGRKRLKSGLKRSRTNEERPVGGGSPFSDL